MRRQILAALAATTVAGSAHAHELRFTADLRGDRPPTATGSKATGHADLAVNTDARTVDLTLDVRGLRIEDLRSGLLDTPMGPIHLHLYGRHDHSDPNADVRLVFPAPYGDTYAATPEGFQVRVKAAPYAEGARRVNSSTSFEGFVTALEQGAVVLNIHTNAQPDGEISGDVHPIRR